MDREVVKQSTTIQGPGLGCLAFSLSMHMKENVSDQSRIFVADLS